MTLLVFSTLLFFAERGIWDESREEFIDFEGHRSKFESIPAAGWFVVATISTVGYGDVFPRTPLGTIITIPLLLFGLLLIALPSFVLGREFSVLWDTMGGPKGGFSRKKRRDYESIDVASPAIIRRTGVELTGNTDEIAMNEYPSLGEQTRFLSKELQETRADLFALRKLIKDEFLELRAAYNGK